MFPILLTLGNFPVSSFGLFLLLGIFFGSFTVWRIARSFDYEAEKVLDLIFLNVGISFVFSRLTFILINPAAFDSLTKIFFINRYPGLFFWGGFLGGLISLWWLSRKNERVLSSGNRIPFLQLADISIIGFFIAAFFTEIGCLLGGCGVGAETTFFFGVDQAGAIGKRLPIQFFEAAVFLIFFFSFWKAILKFHIQGSFLARGLMVLGLVKFIAEFFKAQEQILRLKNFQLNLGLIFSSLVFLLGVRVYYKAYKKTPRDDLALAYRILSNRRTQNLLMTKISREWYNHWVNLRLSLGKGRKKLFKLLNIKSNPDSFSNK